MNKSCFRKTLLKTISVIILVAITACSKEEEPKPQDNIDYEQLKESVIQELINYAKVPRPGYHLDKARAYLKQYAEERGWQWERDDYGNCWIDVPATKGKEHFPELILQGHMDMVCAQENGENHDFLTEVGTPVREGNLLYGKHINLGIDNAVGIAISLALVTSDIEHGPIRCLFTADEDQGMEGAKFLSKDAINSNYLLCLDGEQEGRVYLGCAGLVLWAMQGERKTSDPQADMQKTSIVVNGLQGGHSGADINKPRISGITIIREILHKVMIPNNGQLICLNSGFADNAIA